MNIGNKLFDFELPATDGKVYSNYTLAAKSILAIIVSCNHCKYSRSYWNRIKTLMAKYEEDNIGLLVINSNDASQYPEDSFENMKIMADQLGNTFPYLYDETQEIAKKLDATRTPEVFLFNQKRELVYKGAIDDAWENEQSVTLAYLEDAIEFTLDGLEVDYPEIPAIGCSIKWKK